MLGPANLATSQLKVALKPTAGWEKQLYVSTAPHADLGVFNIQALNSGVFTANTADAAILRAAPQELLAVLENDVNSQAQLVVTVTGTDNFDNAYTAVATIKPPSYSNFQENVFPKTYAVDFLPAVPFAKCKTITSVSVVANVDVVPTPIRIVGVPSVDTAPSATGAYRVISTKVKLDTMFKIPEAHPVQNGRDKSTWVKPGEIPAGQVSITSKEPTLTDGVARLNGTRVTACIREIKEGKVETSRLFLLGMVMTAKESAGESIEDVTLEAANAFYEIGAMVLAQ